MKQAELEANAKKIVTGKDLKRTIVSNVPFEYGLIESDLHDWIIIKASEMEELVEIKEIAINPAANSAIVEVADKKMSEFIEKLDG